MARICVVGSVNADLSFTVASLPRPGQTVLVQGAGGGVSTAAVLLGRAAGLRIWVTSRSEEKRARAVELGAHGAFESGARLPERHARFLGEGDAVRIAARGPLSGDAEAAGEGRIEKVYPELEAGQVVVDIAAPGLGDFFVGERVRLEVATGERDAIVVPADRLRLRYGVAYARLQTADGPVEVVVQPGGEVDGGVEVLAGLRPGDRLAPWGAR